MKRKYNTWAILIAILFVNSAQAQVFVERSEQTPNFADVERAFIEWSEGQDLSEVKGWKWYKRWEAFYAQRVNGDGTMPDPNIFLKEAIKHSKGSNASVNKSAWIPAGPDLKPPSLNPYSSHGVARINCIEFHPSDPNTFWIGASQGGIWKTTNGGTSWTPIADGLPILRISDIEVDPNNPDVLYACVGDFEYNAFSLQLNDRKRHTHYGLGVYKTMDGGINWSATGLTVLQTDLDYSLLRRVLVDPTNSNNLVAVGFEGAWKSTDAGATWTNTLQDYLLTDLEMDASNPAVLYAGSAHVTLLNDGTSGVFKSTDFGATWNVLNTGIPTTVGKRVDVGIALSNANIVYAVVVNSVGGFYGMYRSVDAGLTWTQQSDGSNLNILAWSDGVGEVGGQGSYDLAFVVDPIDADVVHVGGVNVWGSTDGGVSWNGSSYWLPYYGPSVHADQHQFKYNPVSDRFYLCNDGGIYQTDSIIIGSWDDVNNDPNYNWPTVWEDLSDGMQITSFYRLSVDSPLPGAILAGAQDNSTFYFNGTSWSNVIGGDGMEAVFHPDDADIFWGSSQYGNLVRTNDGGQNFDGISGSILGQEDGEWTTPYIYSSGSNALYAGFGNVWKSTNDGNSWQSLSNFSSMPGAGFPAPASALVQSRNNLQTLYVAKRIYHSYGQLSELYVTHDEGGSWQNITAGLPDTLYFTYLAVDDDNPNLAWVTCSGFADGTKVFQTNDGGVNWNNISGNLPNIPVNCIALDETSPEHAVFIGTDLGVYTRNDGASAWSLYSNNLPNVIISELEIDYDEGEMYAATFGRGIWKTAVPLSTGTLENPTISMQLFPNPNQGQFVLEFEHSGNGEGQLEIVDVKGRKIHEREIALTSGHNSIEFNMSLQNGIYFVRLKENGHSSVLRFVKE